MSDLHKMPKIKLQNVRRLGRGTGSGRGAKSTRGTKRHQKAKEKIPIFFEGGQNRLTKKFPLLRGKGRNKPLIEKPVTINLNDLESLKSPKKEIDVRLLVDLGIVDVVALKVGVKVLNTGTLTKSLNVRLLASKNAKIAIEKAGGTVL